jgi:hypothetical protein
VQIEVDIVIGDHFGEVFGDADHFYERFVFHILITFCQIKSDKGLSPKGENLILLKLVLLL